MKPYYDRDKIEAGYLVTFCNQMTLLFQTRLFGAFRTSSRIALAIANDIELKCAVSGRI